ncbi:LAETG motif-containing sortase-dependent surface protein [Streptomyces achromogenes]|uniref:LAETG motif-containing sortase-dependent surface protein n=1 Tax=Streptomyces achromogenes TaxID=67255 RepID=UPI0036CEA1CC
MKYRPAVITAAASLALLAGTPAAGAAEGGPDSLPACTDVSTAYGDYEQRDLKASLDITAGELVPGADWTPAKGTLTNLGRRDLPAVAVSAYPWLQTDDPEYQDMTKFVKVEVRAEDGTWQPASGTGTVVSAPLPSGRSHTYDLRVRVVEDVPAGLGGSEFNFTGTFADVYRFPDTGKEVECAAEAIGYDAFHVRRASTPKPTPSSARPTPTASQTSPAPTATPASASPTVSPSTTASASPSASPASTTSAAPVPVPAPSSTGGELAETGGSDATLPLAAAAGGLAVLGAGAVAFARRRRG